MKKLYTEFTAFMGKGEKYDEVPENTFHKYKDIFMGTKDQEDIIPQIWREYGLRMYKNGLFQLVNPDNYNELARKFSNVSDHAIVFAKSLTGCLFLWEKYDFGWAITHLNVHSGENEVIGANFCIFFEWDICERDYWNEECYGKIEFKALKKIKRINPDECVGFSPVGSENIESIQVFKTTEHLNMLAKLKYGNN